jgi:hypothetical protein
MTRKANGENDLIKADKQVASAGKFILRKDFNDEIKLKYMKSIV